MNSGRDSLVDSGRSLILNKGQQILGAEVLGGNLMKVVVIRGEDHGGGGLDVQGVLVLVEVQVVLAEDEVVYLSGLGGEGLEGGELLTVRCYFLTSVVSEL